MIKYTVVIAFIMVTFGFTTSYAKLPNHIYYISSSTGDDQNNGSTPEQAIRSLTKASEIDLLPGDQLLLKAGDKWTHESLLPKGSGTPENPVVIAVYGEGAKPHIQPGLDCIYGIRIVNEAGYYIKGIEISDCYGGLVVWLENTYDHSYLWVEDCFFHDITDKDIPINGGKNGRPVTPDLLYGMGISICGSDAYGRKTLLSDVTISNCKFDKCDVGIEVIGRDHDPEGLWRRHGHDLISPQAFRNVNILDCDVQRSYRSGGVMLYCITGGTARNVVVNETGYEGVGMWWGVAAFQCTRMRNYLVEDCIFSNTIKGTSPDGQGFDFEADVQDVTVRKCKFINNEGPAVLCYGDSWKGENKGCVIDSCYIDNNNWSTDGDYIHKVFGVGKPRNSGIIKNTEIHLRTNEQDFYCFPLVFDSSNKVYTKEGKLIYHGFPTYDKPILEDDFRDGFHNWKKITKKSGWYIPAKPGNWENYFFEVKTKFEETEQILPLLFAVKDQDNYYLAEVFYKPGFKSEMKISHVQKGICCELEVIPCQALPAEATLRIDIYKDKVYIFINGNLMGQTEQVRELKGPVGLSSTDAITYLFTGNF